MRIFLFQDHFSKHRKELVAVGLPILPILSEIEQGFTTSLRPFVTIS